MKRTVLAVVAFFGLAALVGGAGSALAGGNTPQEHWSWQYEEPIGTGTLPESDAAKAAEGTAGTRDPGMSSGIPDFDSDPRWKESGGE